LGGQIARIAGEKSVLSPGAAQPIAAEALDTYINSYYRSARNLASNLRLAAHLDTTESIPPLLTALFALHGRVRPFNKFLRWELENFPLDGEPWAVDVLLPRLEAIAKAADLLEQQTMFRDVELVARERGLGGVVDGWEPDVAWLHGQSTRASDAH